MAVEPETFFAIVSPNVTLHPSVRIEERRQNFGKTEPAISHAAIVFRIIPLEPDMGSVRQQPSLPVAEIVMPSADLRLGWSSRAYDQLPVRLLFEAPAENRPL